MAKLRTELHEKLCEVLGSRNCYYSPPASLFMKYPCIRYNCDGDATKYADNREYTNMRRYTLLFITSDPDGWDMIDRLKEKFTHCRFDRYYTADNLSHFVLTVYY